MADLVSIVSLSLRAAGALTKVILSLRSLHRKFSYALEHAEALAQEIGTIDFAIRQICTLLQGSPETFPREFFHQFQSAVTVVAGVVGQIQEHVDLINSTAETSPNTAKVKHLWHTEEVAQWENKLRAQVAALSLLIQITNLRSSRERTLVLEQSSSRRIFEMASSMSAKIGDTSLTRSSPLGQSCVDQQTFEFDTELLRTRVYRRACESLLRGSVSTTGNVGQHCGQSSLPLSSANCSALQPEHPGADDVAPPPKEDTQGDIFSGPQLALEGSTLNAAQITAASSGNPTTMTSGEFSNPTLSTVATTFSSQIESKSFDELAIGVSALDIYTVIVIVDSVGSEQTNLEVSTSVSEDYSLIGSSISCLRDRILASSGITPAAYNATTECTIQGSGQNEHSFPFTEIFLKAALNEVVKGLYAAITIVAHVSKPVPSKETELVSHPVASAPKLLKNLSVQRRVPHTKFHISDKLPFITKAPVAKGGYGRVYKVMLDNSFENSIFIGRAFLEKLRFDTPFAVKEISSQDQKAAKRIFQNEVNALKSLPSHPHLIDLIATFGTYDLAGEKVIYSLLYPWADGNLRQFWENNDSMTRTQRKIGHQTLTWTVEQCAGLASGLSKIHMPSNSQRGSESENIYGRHGDIKPENILWFNNDHGAGTLKIADFGLARFHRGSTVRSSSDRESDSLVYGAPACTPSYRAPECDMHHSRISPSYDIFSLGCVFLEFITWELCGSEAVKDLMKRRFEENKNGELFGRKAGKIILSLTAQDYFAKLRATATAASLDDSSANAYISALALTEACLEINTKDRPTARELAESLGWILQGLGEPGSTDN